MDDTPDPTDQEPDAHEASARRNATIGWAIIGLLLAAAHIAVTTVGFGPYEATDGEARPPTLWDWLGLLIVPLAVAAGAAFISYVQKRTELDIANKARQEDRRNAEQAREKDREIAQQARESEQQIAGDRLRQASLEGYYDRMTDLLLEHGLRVSATDSEVRSIARARTVAVVKALDGERNVQLLSFLRTSELIAKDKPIVNLYRVDFSKADLQGADLSEVNLSGADLSEANLSKAHLSEADLSEAYLSEANLNEANLCRANLSDANLGGATLGGADLCKANLSKADLWMAMLSWANLTDAIDWTIEQFDHTWPLEGTIMPDGVQLRSEFNPDDPTYAEWKAAYLAKQQPTASQPDTAGAITGLLTNLEG